MFIMKKFLLFAIIIWGLPFFAFAVLVYPNIDATGQILDLDEVVNGLGIGDTAPWYFMSTTTPIQGAGQVNLCTSGFLNSYNVKQTGFSNYSTHGVGGSYLTSMAFFSDASCASKLAEVEFSYSIGGGGGVQVEFLNVTRILSVRPVYGEATTSPFQIEVDYYIASGDEDTQIILSLSNLSEFVVSAPSMWTFDSFDVSGSGYFSYSTTTSLTEGTYELLVEAMDTLFGLPVQGQRDTAVSIFSVGAQSPYGELVTNFYEEHGRVSSSTVANLWDTCVTSLVQCVVHIVVPTKDQWYFMFDTLRKNVLKKPPIGWVTLLVESAVASSTESLSNLTLTIPSGLPQGGSVIEVVNWAESFGSTSFLGTVEATSTGLTFWEIVEPTMDILIYSLAGISALFLLIKFHP